MISSKLEGVVYVSRGSISVDEDVTWMLREAARRGLDLLPLGATQEFGGI